MSRYILLSFALAGALFLPQAEDPKKLPDGADAFEANNTPDKATSLPLDKEIQATIFPRADRDFYRFTLDHAARVTLKAVSPSPAISLLGRLTTPAGQFILERSGGPGRTLVLVADLRAGNYVLEIRDGPHEEFDRPRWYDMRESRLPYHLLLSAAKAPDSFEPNDDPKKLSPLALGKEHQTWLFPAGDQDNYRITVPEPGLGEVRVAVTGVAENISLHATLVDPDGRGQNVQAPPGKPLFWNAPVGKPGDYRLLLQSGSYYRQKVYKGSGSDGSLGPMSLRVDYLDVGDRFEPNNTLAQAAALPLGKPHTATLFPAGDHDCFKISLPVGKRGMLRVEVDGLPDSIHPELVLYDKQQRGIRTLGREKGQPLIFLHALAGDDYYLHLHDRGMHNGLYHENADDTGSRLRYRIQADFLVPETDEAEPNDRIEQAAPIALGETRTCTLLPEDDNDFFRFTLKEDDPDLVQIVVSGLHSRIFTRLNLFDKDRRGLTGTKVQRDGTQVLNAWLQPGDYYFSVEPTYASNGVYAEGSNTQFQMKPFQVTLVPVFRTTQVLDKNVHHLGEQKLNHFVKPDAEGLVFKQNVEIKNSGEHDAVLISAHYLNLYERAETGAYVHVNGKEIGWLNPHSVPMDKAWQTLVVDIPPGLLKAGSNEIVLSAKKPKAGSAGDWEFRQVALGRRLYHQRTDKGAAAVTRAELQTIADSKEPAPLVSGKWHEFRLTEEGDGLPIRPTGPERWFTVDTKSRGYLRLMLPGPHFEVEPRATLYRVEGDLDKKLPRVLYLRGRTDRTRLDEFFPEVAFARVEAADKEAAGVLLDWNRLEKFDAIVIDGLAQLTQFDMGSEKSQAQIRTFAEAGKRVLFVDPLCSLEALGVKNIWGEANNDRTVDVPSNEPLFAGARGSSAGWPGFENGGKIENYKEAGLTPLAVDTVDPAKWAVTAFRPVGKGAVIFETMLLGHPANQPDARRRLQWLLGLQSRLDHVTTFEPINDHPRFAARLGTSPVLEAGKYRLHMQGKGQQHSGAAPMLLRGEFLDVAAKNLPGATFLSAQAIEMGDKTIALAGKIDEHQRELWYRLQTSAQKGASILVEGPEEVDLTVDLYLVGRIGNPSPGPKATGKKVLYLRGPYPNHNLDQYFPDIEWHSRAIDSPQAWRLLVDTDFLRGFDAVIVDAVNNETQYGLNHPVNFKGIEAYVQQGGRFIVLSPVCALPGLGIKQELVGHGTFGKAIHWGDAHELVDAYKGPRGTLDAPSEVQDEVGAFADWATAGYQPLYRHLDNPEQWAVAVAKKAGKGYYILDAQRVSGDDMRGAFDWKLYMYLGAAPAWEFVRTIDNAMGRAFGGPEQFDLPPPQSPLAKGGNGGDWFIRVTDRKKAHWSRDPFHLKVTPVFSPSAEEPNDTPDKATLLPFGKTLEGKLFPSGDRDVYRLHVETTGLVRVLFDHPADNIDAELTLVRDDVAKKKVLLLKSGRNEYNLMHRRLAGVDFTVREPSAGTLFLEEMQQYQAVILDGLTHPAHYGINLAPTQQAIAKYVEGGGTFIVLCPQVADPKGLRFWGVELVPGWRNNNIVVVDDKHPLHQRRASGSLAFEHSETFGHLLGWKEAGFDMVYADSGDKAKNAVLAVKNLGKGMLILDALEISHPAHADAGLWHLANLLDAPPELFLNPEVLKKPGVPRFDERIIPQGTYYLTVKDNPLLGNFSNASPLLYTLRADFLATPELAENKEGPNQVGKDAGAAEAVDLLPGLPANVLMWPAGRAFWYRVANPAPGKITLDLTDVSDALDPVVEVYRAADSVGRIGNPSHKPWKKFDNTTGKAHGGPEHVEFEVLASATYYLKIYDREGVGQSLTAMRLQMSFSAVDCPFEINHELEGALPLISGYSYPLNLYPARDSDWFRVTLANKGPLAVSIAEVPAELAVRVEILKGLKLFQPVHQREGKPGEALDFKVDLGPGTYFVVLRPGGDGAFAPGLFTFKATCAAALVPPPLRVVGQWPGPEIAGSLPDSPIKIAFDRPIKVEGLDQLLKVEGSRSGLIKGKVEVDAKTQLLLFRSGGAFVPGEKISVALAGVRDLDGKELAAKTEWTFAIGTPRVAETIVQLSLSRRKLGVGKHAVMLSSTLPLSEAPAVSLQLTDSTTVEVRDLARGDDGKWRGILMLDDKTANGPARFAIAGKDSLGRKLQRLAGDITLEIDTLPPPAMLPLVLEQRPQGKLGITWNRPEGVADLAGYRLYRTDKEKPAAKDLVLIAEISNAQTTYHDDLPPADGVYLYSIAGVDEAGNAGPLSTFSRGMSVRTGPKLVVQDFAAKVDKGKVLLTWKQTVEAGVVGYNLHRFVKKEEGEKIDVTRPYRRLNPVEQATTDQPVDGKYYYLLAARDAAGNLGPSGKILEVVVDTQPARGVLTVAGKPPLTAGEHQVAIKLNEKLKGPLKLKVRLPDGKMRELPVKAVDDLNYQTVLTLGKDDPDGDLQFFPEGEDLYGNTGIWLDAGGYLTFDNAPPRIRVWTDPDSKYRSGTIKMVVQFMEPIIGEPKFAFKVAGKSFPLAMKLDRPFVYSGVMQLAADVPNGPAQLDIVATDRFGHTGGIFDFGRDFIIKTTLPGPPTGVRVQAGPENTLEIHWKAPLGETISFFRLYTGDQADFAAAAKTLAQDRVYNLTTRYLAKAEKTVFFRVTAVDPAGNESKPSDALRGEPDSTPPPPVSDVVAVIQKDGQVKVAWKADAIKEPVRFLLYRGKEESPVLAKLQPVAVVKESFTIDRPSDTAEYFYHVVAEDLAGNQSPPAKSAKLSFDVLPPVAEVRLAPVNGVLPYWGPGEQLWRLDVVNAGKLQVRLKFNEPLAELPILRYRSKLFETPKVLTLKVEGQDFVGELDIAQGKEDGMLQFLVTAKDRAGNVGQGFALGERCWIDSTPPDAPAKLEVERLAFGKIGLSWPVPAGERLEHLRFHLYRSEKPIAGVAGMKPLVTVEGDLRFMDSPALEGDFHYVVVAEDLGGNRGKPSPVATTRSDTTPPPPPTELVAVLDKDIRLSWKPAAEPGVRYRLYRAVSPMVVDAKQRIADDLAEAGFSDLPQTDGTFHYAVTAVDGSGNESQPSNIVKLDFLGKVPRARIEIVAQKTDVPRIPPLVRGAFQVKVTTSLPLIETPQLFLQIAGRSDAIPLAKVGADARQWQGNFELAKDYPNGAARFSFRGVGAGGFVGAAIEHGREIVIDTTPPTAHLSLSRRPPLPAGEHQATLSASEPLAGEPQLLLITLGATPRKVPLTPVEKGEGNRVFRGSFTLTKEDRDGQAVFAFLGMDLAGNEARLENLAPFAIDHHPPKAPTDLKARSLAEGRIDLTWQGPLYLANEMFDQIAGYNIYRAAKPLENLQGLTPIHVGLLGLQMIDRPDADGEYYYAISTLDASGLESPPTAWTKVTSDRTPPLAPRIVEVKQLPAGIGIAWESDDSAGGPLVYKVLVWTEEQPEPIIVAEKFAGTRTEYRPLVSGTYVFRLSATDAVGNESALSIPQSIAYQQLAPVARLGFSKPLPWGEGPVDVTVNVNRPLEAAPKLVLVVGAKEVPITLAGAAAQWQGKVNVDAKLGAETGVFQFSAVVKEQGKDLEGTGIVEGRAVRLDFTPPTVALRFGPEFAVKDRQVVLKAGKIEFTVESSEPLKEAPVLTFTPQGKESVKINLAPKDPRTWLASLVLSEDLGIRPGLFEFAGADPQGNAGKEITEGRNVLIRTRPPGTVAQLRAVSLPGGRVRLDWTPPLLSDGAPDKSANRFRLYRGDAKILSIEGLTPLVEVQRVLGHLDVPSLDRHYFYTVVAVDEAGNAGPPAASVSVHVDRTPPAPPRELVVSETSSGAVKLSWKAPVGEKPAFYRVYLEKSPIQSVKDLRPQSDVVPFTEIYGTPNANGKYYFAITAVDEAFNESPPGNVAFLDYKSIAPMAFFSIFKGEKPPEAQGTLTVQTPAPLSRPPQLVITGPAGETRKLALTGEGASWSARIVPAALFPERTAKGADTTYMLELTTSEALTEAPRVFFQPEAGNARALPFHGAKQRFTADLTPRSFFRIDPRIWLTDGPYTVTLWTTEALREPPKVIVHSESRPASPLSFAGAGAFWQARLNIDVKFPEGQYGFTFEGVDAAGNIGTEVREGPLFRVDRQAPLAPEKMRATNADGTAPGAVKVAWSPPQKAGAEIPHFYHIYRSRKDFAEIRQADLVRVFRVTVEGQGSEETLDVPPENGAWYYRVTSLDLAGNESGPSPAVTVTVSTRTPRAEIRLSTKQSGDAPATRVGKGGADVLLITNVPLREPPTLRWFLKSKPADKRPVLLTGGGVRFQGKLQLNLTEDTEEEAAFEFHGFSEEGVEGNGIRGGESFTADTIGPEARIIIPSVYEMKITVKPEGGGELKVPPVQGGRVKVEVELREPPADVPELKYNLDGGLSSNVPLAGFGCFWHGWMDISQGLALAQGKLFFKALDLAGNESTKITRREYPRELDELSFPPRTLRNFATTGGEFTVDSLPPDPPVNVVLAARKLGVAEIRWDSPQKPGFLEKPGFSEAQGEVWTYRLYRSLVPLVGQPLQRPVKSDILARVMVDDPPVDGNYFYAVTAVDLAGNESILSACPSIFLDTIKQELKIKAVPQGEDFVILFPEVEPLQAEITLRFPGQKEFKVSLGGDSGQLKKVERIIDGKPTACYVLPQQAGFFNGKVEVIVHSPDPEGNRIEALTETAYQKINASVGGEVHSADGNVKLEIPAGVAPVIPTGPKEFKRVSGYDQLYFISYQRIPETTSEAAKKQDPQIPDPVPPGLDVIGVPYTIHLNDAPQEPMSLKAAVTQADLSGLQQLKPKLTMKIPEYYSDVVKDPEYLKSRLKVIKWVPTPGGEKKRGHWELVPDIEIKSETGEVITPADSITTYVIVSERTPPTVLDATPEPNGSTRDLRPVISARVIDKGTGVAMGAENPIYLTIDGQKAPAGLVQLTGDDPTEVKLTFTPPADLVPGMHLVAIRAEDVVGNVANYQWRFTIDDQPPVISGIHPPEGAVTAATRPLISAMLADEGGIAADKIHIKLDDLESTADEVRFDPATGLVNWWPTQDLASGEHKVAMAIHDRTGQASHRTWTFVIDHEPPRIAPPQIKGGMLSVAIADRLSEVAAQRLGLFVNGAPIMWDGLAIRPTGEGKGEGYQWQPAQGLLSYVLPADLSGKKTVVKIFAQDVWGNHQVSSWLAAEGEPSLPLDREGTVEIAPTTKIEPATVKEKEPPPVEKGQDEKKVPQQLEAEEAGGAAWWWLAGAALLAIAAGSAVVFLRRKGFRSQT